MFSFSGQSSKVGSSLCGELLFLLDSLLALHQSSFTLEVLHSDHVAEKGDRRVIRDIRVIRQCHREFRNLLFVLTMNVFMFFGGAFVGPRPNVSSASLVLNELVCTVVAIFERDLGGNHLFLRRDHH